MNDEDFDNVMKHLFHIANQEGDVGYEYWWKIMQQLKEMRQQAEAYKTSIGAKSV